jgi:3-methyl-2-oxobutanoate hydroxymethyltransferase
MNKKIKKILNKKNKSKVICLTAYSKNIASILDNHCDLVLVGDSLGSVLYNYKSTKEVTLNTMINHSKSVRLGVKRSLMIVDMPYKTYRNPKEALKNAKLVMKKTKCDGIKLEGGKKIIPTVKLLIKNKIPVMGHLGILPQTEKKFTFKGKKLNEINKLIKDSKLLEEAGIFSIVLECVEMKLAKKITQLLKIPTIGIGSSVNCDGQVLVIDDLIGLSESKFRFVKKYANINQVINLAVKKYKSEVLKKEFPKAKHSFKYSKTIP